MKTIYFILFLLCLYTGNLISQTLNDKESVIQYLSKFTEQNNFVNSDQKSIDYFYPEEKFLYTKILPQKMFLSYQIYSNDEIKNLNLIVLSINLDELNNYELFVDNVKNKSKTLNTLYEANRAMAFIDVKNDNSELFIYYYFDGSVYPIETMRNLQHFINTYQIHSS